MVNALASYVRVTSAEEVAESAAKARSAQVLWRRYNFTERVRCIRDIRREISNARDRLIQIMFEDSGAPLTDLLLAEMRGLDAVLKYFTRHAHRILKDRPAPRSWFHLNKRAYVRNTPYGLVGIVSSRGFPILGPLSDALTALIAGNAVILKPAETDFATYSFLSDLIRTSAVLPENLLQVLPGDASTGLSIVKESDMVVYTGSPTIGHEIARHCSDQFKPLILELGGKHAMIVLRDAPLERAAGAAVWGAFSRSGQSSLNVQRAFVESEIYPAFTGFLIRALPSLRQSFEFSYETELGRLLNAKQMDIFAEHLNDAKDRGARVIGGEVKDKDNLVVAPALVLDASLEMKVMREETPGPVIAVMLVRSGEEAIRLVNRSPYGLAASIWTQDLARAEAWTAYLDAGLISINEISEQYSICSLPFGALKESGTGRRHADEGLRAFCQQQSIVIHEWPAFAPEPHWFPYTDLKTRMLAFLSRLT